MSPEGIDRKSNLKPKLLAGITGLGLISLAVIAVRAFLKNRKQNNDEDEEYSSGELSYRDMTDIEKEGLHKFRRSSWFDMTRWDKYYYNETGKSASNIDNKGDFYEFVATHELDEEESKAPWKKKFGPESEWVFNAVGGSKEERKPAIAIEERWKDEQGDSVRSVSFSADGRYLATGSYDKTVRCYDPETGEELWKDEQGDTVLSVAFSTDGRYLATGSDDRTVRYYDTETGKELWRDEQDDFVYSVVFSADGRYLATGSGDWTVQCYELPSRAPWKKKFGPGSEWVFNADGDSKDIPVPMINIKERWKDKQGGSVISVAFSADGRYLATGAYDRTVRCYDPETGEERWQREQSSAVFSVALSADGRYFATGSDDNTVRCYDSETRKQLWKDEQGGTVYSVAFSADGRYLATGSSDYTVRCYDPETGKELWKNKQGGTVYSVTFSADGRYLVTGSNDYTVRCYELPSRAPWKKKFGPESEWVFNAVSSIKEERKPAIAIEERWKDKQGDSVCSVVFSADGRYLATGSFDKTVRCYDPETGEERWLKKQDDWVYSVAFSDEGKYFATGSRDKTVRCYDPETGEELWRDEQGGSVISVAFSADGRYLATGSDDKTVRCYELRQRAPWKKKYGPGSEWVFNSKPSTQKLIRLRMETANAVDELGRFFGVNKKFKDYYPSYFSIERLIDEGGEHYAVVDDSQFQMIWPEFQDVYDDDYDEDIHFKALYENLQRLTESKVVYEFLWIPLYIEEQAMVYLGRENELEYNIKPCPYYDWFPVKEITFGITLRQKARLNRFVKSFYRDKKRYNRIRTYPAGTIPALHRFWTMLLDMVKEKAKTDPPKAHLVKKYDPEWVFNANNDNGKEEPEPMIDIKELWQDEQGDFVNSVTFSADGRYLATGSNDDTVRCYDPETGEELWKKRQSSAVLSVAFSADGRYLATGSLDNTVRCYDPETGEELWQNKQGGYVYSVAFSADGRYLATGHSGGVRCYELPHRAPWKKKYGPESEWVFNADGDSED